jgi:uncharacterized phage infection (PIP) family protein YhgE
MENEILNRILLALNELRQGQAKLEAGQAKLEAGQAGLVEEVQEIQSELKELRQGQAKLEAGQAKLEAGQAGLAAEIQEVKERVVLIENVHSQSLKALHDGYVSLHDIATEIREDIRRLYIHQERQDIRIMLLDDEKRKTGDAV